MEKVVILSEAEYQALQDEIHNLKISKARYFDKYHNEVTANEYINGLLLQISELTEEECLKDSMYCEQRDLVQRLRDDLANQAELINQLERRNADLEDALGSIRYEVQAVL